MLKRPYISEKSMSLVKSNFFTFEVSKQLTKNQIAKLVKDKFKVDVLSVRTVNIPGKIKMQRTRKGYFRESPLKKAIVQLKKGQKIALFEAPGEEKGEVKVTTAEGEKVAVVKEKKSLLRGTRVKIEKSPSAKASGDKKKKGKK